MLWQAIMLCRRDMRKFIYIGEGICPQHLANQLKSCGIQVESDIKRIPEDEIDEKHKAHIMFFRKLGAYSADFESLGDEMMVTITFKKAVKFDKDALEVIKKMKKEGIKDIAIDNAGSDKREFAINYSYSL